MDDPTFNIIPITRDVILKAHHFFNDKDWQKAVHRDAEKNGIELDDTDVWFSALEAANFWNYRRELAESNLTPDDLI